MPLNFQKDEMCKVIGNQLETKEGSVQHLTKEKNKEKKLLRKGLVKLIEEMKRENKCLSNKVQVEMAKRQVFCNVASFRETEKQDKNCQTSDSRLY